MEVVVNKSQFKQRLASRTLWPLLTSACSTIPCSIGYSSQSVSHRPPRVPHVSFSPSICHIYHAWFRVVMGLWLVVQPYPHAWPRMWFLFVRPEICPWVSIFLTSSFLQIPPRGGHPYLRLYPSHYRADLELAPFGNVRRQAHTYSQYAFIKAYMFQNTSCTSFSWQMPPPRLLKRQRLQLRTALHRIIPISLTTWWRMRWQSVPSRTRKSSMLKSSVLQLTIRDFIDDVFKVHF